MNPDTQNNTVQKKKRALVTGASGDLGRAIASALANSGLHVVLHANSRLQAAQAVAEEIVAAGGSAEALAFNLTDREATAAACALLLEAGPIQVLVNNAGTHDDAAFPALRAAQWQQVMDVSVNGFFNVTQPLTMPMIRTRWGRIINISSIASLTGNRGQVNYAAAKGALNSATKSLSLELASRGITVNAVAPGIIESTMIEGAFDKALIERLVPMKRAGRAEEVAALVAFLASDAAGYISGQIISINGGMA
jgi:3-oxoacyl-[acyl-carrier protein] reductase